MRVRSQQARWLFGGVIDGGTLVDRLDLRFLLKIRGNELMDSYLQKLDFRSFTSLTFDSYSNCEFCRTDGRNDCCGHILDNRVLLYRFELPNSFGVPGNRNFHKAYGFVSKRTPIADSDDSFAANGCDIGGVRRPEVEFCSPARSKNSSCPLPHARTSLQAQVHQAR
jgi:hypothetical protein